MWAMGALLVCVLPALDDACESVLARLPGTVGRNEHAPPSSISALKGGLRRFCFTLFKISANAAESNSDATPETRETRDIFAHMYTYMNTHLEP